MGGVDHKDRRPALWQAFCTQAAVLNYVPLSTFHHKADFVLFDPALPLMFRAHLRWAVISRQVQ